MSEYIVKCGCGFSFRAWTPKEGYAGVTRHNKIAHGGESPGMTMTLEGFEWAPSLDAFNRALREQEVQK
jgi:hypothetical protein